MDTKLPKMVLTIEDEDGNETYYGLDESNKESMTFKPMDKSFKMNVTGQLTKEQSEQALKDIFGGRKEWILMSSMTDAVEREKLLSEIDFRIPNTMKSVQEKAFFIVKYNNYI